MQRGVHRGPHHRLLVSRGVVPKVVSRPGSSIAWLLRRAEGRDPDRLDSLYVETLSLELLFSRVSLFSLTEHY